MRMSESVRDYESLKSEYVFRIHHFKNSVLYCLQYRTDFNTLHIESLALKVIVTACV